MPPNIELLMPTGNIEKFDDWNEEKKYLHFQEQNGNTEDVFVNPGEVWYVKLGINIGFEQNGKAEFRRPVLVIKKIGNMFFCVPLTTKGKENFFYKKISLFGKEQTSYLIVSQGKSIDKRRFMDIIGTVPKHEFETIKKSLKEIYF